MRILGLVLVFAFATLVGWAAEPQKAPEYPPTTTPAEAELGAKTAESIEKDYKLIKDDAQIARINAIANAIAPVTQRPQVVYKCKILDTGALNAMAIPGIFPISSVNITMRQLFGIGGRLMMWSYMRAYPNNGSIPRCGRRPWRQFPLSGETTIRKQKSAWICFRQSMRALPCSKNCGDG